jgi:hypothetical protein
MRLRPTDQKQHIIQYFKKKKLNFIRRCLGDVTYVASKQQKSNDQMMSFEDLSLTVLLYFVANQYRQIVAYTFEFTIFNSPNYV